MDDEEVDEEYRSGVVTLGDVSVGLVSLESGLTGMADDNCFGLEFSRGGLEDSRILVSRARCFAFANPVRFSSGVVQVALDRPFAGVIDLLSTFSCFVGIAMRSFGGFVVY